jgi:hypothetical protein
MKEYLQKKAASEPDTDIVNSMNLLMEDLK